MAKNIALATVLLLVIWIGSFGIAFGVAEWRSVPGPAGPAGPAAAPDRCIAALEAYGAAASAPPVAEGTGGVFVPAVPQPIKDAFAKYCD
jgi:hypothetical protein